MHKCINFREPDALISFTLSLSEKSLSSVLFKYYCKRISADAADEEETDLSHLDFELFS